MRFSDGALLTVAYVVCRLFSEKGEKLKTLDFKTGAGTYTVNNKKGSYTISGDRVETLGTNMYVMFQPSSLAQSSKEVEQWNILTL